MMARNLNDLVANTVGAILGAQPRNNQSRCIIRITSSLSKCLSSRTAGPVSTIEYRSVPERLRARDDDQRRLGGTALENVIDDAEIMVVSTNLLPFRIAY
ncbi:unnamed protein product [Tilletia caries]|nr:unnamed protein product [Tilletia caries]